MIYADRPGIARAVRVFVFRQFSKYTVFPIRVCFPFNGIQQ